MSMVFRPFGWAAWAGRSVPVESVPVESVPVESVSVESVSVESKEQ